MFDISQQRSLLSPDVVMIGVFASYESSSPASVMMRGDVATAAVTLALLILISCTESAHHEHHSHHFPHYEPYPEGNFAYGAIDGISLQSSPLIPWGYNQFYSAATIKPKYRYPQPTPEPGQQQNPDKNQSPAPVLAAAYCDCRAEVKEAMKEMQSVPETDMTRTDATTRRPRRRGSTTTTTRPNTLVTVQQTSQVPDDYDVEDDEVALDGQVSDNQKPLESRRRERITRFMDESLGQPSYEASLEFLCDKFHEYKRMSSRLMRRSSSSSSLTSNETSTERASTLSLIDRRDFREVSFVNILPGRDDEGYGSPGYGEDGEDTTTRQDRASTSPPIDWERIGEVNNNNSISSIPSPSPNVLADQVRFQKIRKRADKLAKQLDQLQKLQRRGGGGSGTKGGRRRNRKKGSTTRMQPAIPQQQQQQKGRTVRENLQNLAHKAKNRSSDVKG